ncbi:hypothetical protein [Lichenicoccus sp.]|uniref:hypothetical protein n=1 Tax=Lichenicoccus sp. TaxID=2781899 RepID=UPI003D0CD222
MSPPRAVPESALPILMPASVRAACRVAAGGREGYFALDTRASRAARCVFTCRFAQYGSGISTWVGGANLAARRLDLQAAGIAAPAGTLFLRVVSAVATCRVPVTRHRASKPRHRRRRHRLISVPAHAR